MLNNGFWTEVLYYYIILSIIWGASAVYRQHELYPKSNTGVLLLVYIVNVIMFPFSLLKLIIKRLL